MTNFQCPEAMAKLGMILPDMVLPFRFLARTRTKAGRIMVGRIIGKGGFAIASPMNDQAHNDQ